MGETTYFNVANRVMDFLVSISSKHIKIPSDEEGKQMIADEFEAVRTPFTPDLQLLEFTFVFLDLSCVILEGKKKFH